MIWHERQLRIWFRNEFSRYFFSLFLWAVAREKLDKMREENESKTRKQLEMTISGLKVGGSPNLIIENCRIAGKTRISWAQSCCFLSFYLSPLLWANNRDASNWIRPSVWRIHYFPIAHDGLCPATFCINIVSISPGYYSRALQFFPVFLVWGEAGGGEHGTLWAMRKCGIEN